MNKTKESVAGIFVTSIYSVAKVPGGQQLCTNEFHDALEASGFTLHDLVFEPANGLTEKLLRRIDKRPYRFFVPKNLAQRVVSLAEEKSAKYIFLNVADVAPVAAEVKKLMPESTIILLSHGLESADYIHELRSKTPNKLFEDLTGRQEVRLGRLLIEECRQRAHIDFVFCLSETEFELERWLGSKRTIVIPRLLSPNFIDWSPISSKAGFVGRLDHPPNLEGLILVLEAVDALADNPQITIEIVGAPQELGEKLERDYKCVKYLGSIDDKQLITHARNWSCAIHPVFCFARGASTKLAVLLGYGLPIVTTTAGMRGYDLDAECLDIANEPHAFAEKIKTLASDETYRRQKQQAVRHACTNARKMEDVAVDIEDFLFNRIETGSVSP